MSVPGFSRRSRRSLDGAELAKRNPGSSGHDHRLGHGNLQESQLAKVDSDAKEGVGRNDDQGRIVTIYYIVTDNPSQVPQ